MPTLTWRRSDGGSQVFHATGPTISVGRESGNDVCIDSTFVSRRHAAIQGNAPSFTIQDLGSANGTFVNGTRVRSAPLAQGDTIKLGSEELLFAVDGAVAGPRWPRLVLAGMLGVLAILVAILFLVPPAAEQPQSAPGSAAPSPSPRPPVAEAASEAPAAPVTTAPLAPAPPVPQPATPQPATAPPPAAPQPQRPAPAAGSGEALYDAALAHIRGDRLIEARQLLIEAIQAGPDNPSARQRLAEVEATIQARIEQHLTAGQQQMSYLRFREAILEWEQVVALTDTSDPRHQQALDAIERARARLGGR